MAKRIQSYRSEEVEVSFDPNLCIHAARCLAGHPDVFDVRRRQWIKPELGSIEDIVPVIERCPSGALQYHRLDGGDDERGGDNPIVYPLPDGPLLLRGDLEISDAEGGVLAHGTRFTLCRCGESANKPFCDNTHRVIGFRAR